MEPIIIALCGEFSAARQRELREALEPAYTCRRAIVDLTGVDYADSLSLCEFMRLRQARARAGLQPACFVLDEDRFGRLFRFLGLHEVLPVVRDADVLRSA
jgi:anti-anti-sigma factor